MDFLADLSVSCYIWSSLEVSSSLAGSLLAFDGVTARQKIVLVHETPEFSILMIPGLAWLWKTDTCGTILPPLVWIHVRFMELHVTTNKAKKQPQRLTQAENLFVYNQFCGAEMLCSGLFLNVTVCILIYLLPRIASGKVCPFAFWRCPLWVLAHALVMLT